MALTIASWWKTLGANRERLRGIAVVPLGLPDRDYAALKEAGVVGIRFNVLFGGGIGLADLDAYGALCRELDWHVQFLVDARQLPDLASRMGRLRVPTVFDHMGHFPAADGVDSVGFQTLLGLVRDGAWVKLSGAYRLADTPYAEIIPLARALHAIAPDRCVWGSDWPHVAHWSHMPNVGDLLDLLADWVPDEAERREVLVGNPARLYGFSL